MIMTTVEPAQLSVLGNLCTALPYMVCYSRHTVSVPSQVQVKHNYVPEQVAFLGSQGIYAGARESICGCLQSLQPLCPEVHSLL